MILYEYQKMLRRLLLSLPLTLACLTGFAQTEETEDDEDVFELSPFEVDGTEDGYRATHTISGSSLNTEFGDVAATVEVLTSEFLEDLGALTLEEAMDFTVSIQGNNEFIDSEGNGLNSVVNPEANSQVRGLGGATRTSNFVQTNLRTDSYNTESITIATGAEAILFGMGSAAGIINRKPKQALTTKSINDIQFRFDNNGSKRASFDFSRPIIDEKLGVRITGLAADTLYSREPSWDKDRRLFGTFTFRPYKGTTIQATYETAERRSSLAPQTLPTDNASPFIDILDEGGEKLAAWEEYRLVDRLEGSTRELENWQDFVENYAWQGQAYHADIELLDEHYKTDIPTDVPYFGLPGRIFNSSGRIMIIQNDKQDPPRVPAPLAETGRGRYISRSWEADEYAYQNPLNQLERGHKFLNTDRLNPYGNFWGEGNILTKDTEVYSFSLEQMIAENLHFQATHTAEESYELRGSQFANGRFDTEVDTDPYRRDELGAPMPLVGLEDGFSTTDPDNYQKNPHYGDLYVRGNPNGRIRERYNDSTRMTLAYQINFADKSDNLAWLGSHSIATLWENKNDNQLVQVYQRRAHNDAFDPRNIPGTFDDRIAGMYSRGLPITQVKINQRFSNIHKLKKGKYRYWDEDGGLPDGEVRQVVHSNNYLQNNSHDIEFLNYLDRDDPFIPVYQDKVLDTWNLTDTAGNPYYGYLFDNPYGSTNQVGGHKRNTQSRMFALQSHFFNRRLVTTMGYRSVNYRRSRVERVERDWERVPGSLLVLTDRSNIEIPSVLDADGQLRYDPENGQTYHYVENTDGYYHGINNNRTDTPNGWYEEDGGYNYEHSLGYYPHIGDARYEPMYTRYLTGINRNFGAVFHATDKISIFAKTSTNFDVPSERWSPLGVELPPNFGESRNIGVRFQLFDRALDLRVDYVDASNNSVNASGEINSRMNNVENIIRAGLVDVNEDLWRNWVDKNKAIYGPDFIDDERENWRSEYNLRSDRKNKGIEFKATWQPNKAWRFMLNGSHSETIEHNIGADHFEFLDYMKEDLVQNYSRDLNEASPWNQFHPNLFDIEDLEDADRMKLIEGDDQADRLATIYYHRLRYQGREGNRFPIATDPLYNEYLDEDGEPDFEAWNLRDYTDPVSGSVYTFGPDGEKEGPGGVLVEGWDKLMYNNRFSLKQYWGDQIETKFVQFIKSVDGRARDNFRALRVNLVGSYGFREGVLKGLRVSMNAQYRSKATIGYMGTQTISESSGEVIDIWDLDRPIYGSTHYPVGINFVYKKKFGNNTYNFGLNVRDMFPEKELRMLSAIPGEDAQGNITNIPEVVGWGLPNPTTYQFSMGVEF